MKLNFLKLPPTWDQCPTHSAFHWQFAVVGATLSRYADYWNLLAIRTILIIAVKIVDESQEELILSATRQRVQKGHWLGFDHHNRRQKRHNPKSNLFHL
jgi:hypothetical protein